MKIPTLTTDRLTLRAPKLDDLPALTAFFTSPQSHAVGGPRNETESTFALNATAGQWLIRGYGSWHIADRDSNAFLGRTGFLFAPGWDEPELGWAITAEAEGKGIAHEATLAARAYGAKHLGLDAPISYIRPDNTRSAALARRLGATLERHGSLRDTPCDIYRHPRLAKAA